MLIFRHILCCQHLSRFIRTSLRFSVFVFFDEMFRTGRMLHFLISANLSRSYATQRPLAFEHLNKRLGHIARYEVAQPDDFDIVCSTLCEEFCKSEPTCVSLGGLFFLITLALICFRTDPPRTPRICSPDRQRFSEATVYLACIR